MDNLSLVGEVDAIGAAGKSILKSVRDRAKAKKAQKISDAGGYLTLTPYQKSLIEVPDYILNQSVGATDAEIKNLPAVMDFGEIIKNNLPAILGFIAVIIVIYFVVKRK